MVRDTSSKEQGCQPSQYILMSQASPHINSQAFSGIFIKNGQQTEAPPIPRPCMNEVVAPHMIPVLRAKPDAGAIIQPQSSTFRLPLRYLQAFAKPDTLYSFVIDLPSFPTEQCGDAAVTIPAIPGRQLYDPLGQHPFVIRFMCIIAMATSRHLKNRACPAFRDGQRITHIPDRLAPLRRAQQFFESYAIASFRIWMSSYFSATSCLSRMFSFSNPFKRLA